MANARNRDLEATLLKLFQDERLRSKDDVTRLFCNHLGFTYAGIPLPSRSDEFWGEGEVANLVERDSFEILAQAGDARLGGFAIVYGTLRDFNLSNQRAIILQLRKSFRDALYVFSKPQTLDRSAGAQLHVIHAKVRAAEADGADASRLILRRFRFGPGERYRTTAERLAKLDLNALKSPSATAITALCNEAFDKEALTTEFFKKLDQHIKAIELDLRENQHLEGPEAFSEAQLLIERLIFLYFAQNRGWLNQSPTYLLDNFDGYRKDSETFGYYQEFLHLLFHTLAEQSFGNRLEGVPFLNGGLFNDDEFKLPSSKLRIRNATFANLFENLLEAYNFTVREDTPLSQEVAVDPEMLGKVFESIVLHAESAGEEYQAPDKRKATGSYYTPRIVVHFICRESLRLYFAQRAELLADSSQRNTWNQRINRLFKEVDSTDGFSEEELKILKSVLSASEAKRCLDCLSAMRTLDPAVGSGAFPVGLLHELISLQRIFETAVKGYQDPVKGSGTQWMQKAKEYFIEHSLFGVDIQQQAIEICRLRLWLSLLVDYELGVNPFEAERSAFISAINRISQLPNLEMNFKRGDSLHDFICDRPVRIEPKKPNQYAADLERIEKLGAKFHKSTRGETKKKFRLEILERRIALALRVISDQIKTLSDQSFNIGADWFGGGLSDSETRARLDEEIDRLQTAFKQLERDEANLRKLSQRKFDKEFYFKLRELEGSEMDGPLNFAWRIDFPHVLSAAPTATIRGELLLVNEAQRQQELTAAHPPKLDGGFDLIVGNPPFVTARNAQKRELYRERWPRVCYKNYLLVCPFFELSFGLLRPQGQLGFIVSNAFAKRDFGKPLIEDFFPTVDLQKIVDCSGLMFPGHGTPTCIVFGVNQKPDDKRPVRVAAILSGGGDLRTPPEESSLWHAIAAQHDKPGYADARISINEFLRKKMASWPWNFIPEVSQQTGLSAQRLSDYCSEPIGAQFITGKDEAFVLPAPYLRRLGIPTACVKAYGTGEDVRNWTAQSSDCILFPYDKKLAPLKEPLPPPLTAHLRPYKETLENSIISGSIKKKDTHLKWFEFRRLARAKFAAEFNIVIPQIATHAHFLECDHTIAFKEKAQAIVLKDDLQGACHLLLLGLLNSSFILDRLKRECFSKRESEEAETDTYYEFSGGKLEEILICNTIGEALAGKPSVLTEHLATLSRACWERGRELPSLALRKLFEKTGEAYHAWNAALPGHVAAHAKLGAPFSTAAELRDRFGRAQSIRDRLRAEMIAQQEEMDWLVYAAYGLLVADDPAAQVETEPAPLDQAHRPFRLWAAAEGDFARAVKLIPADWPKPRRALWEARLAAIRDNEHIRRIEQPVYKRRWDEQWKVGNRWMAGPVAYAQEFVDAFAWWLSEKAEWHLENKSNDRPLALPDWSAAIFKNARVAAAWEVAADAIYEVAKYKFDALDDEKKESQAKPKPNNSYTTFERLFRDTVLVQTVAHGIPPAKQWNELAERKKWTPAQLKKAQAVRGKLNVPRERFQQVSATQFVWAGK
jgi:type I restriction-modification system DNA methylase subunit